MTDHTRYCDLCWCELDDGWCLSLCPHCCADLGINTRPDVAGDELPVDVVEVPAPDRLGCPGQAASFERNGAAPGTKPRRRRHVEHAR